MKSVCIIGWYGTETLGDRAILDGIIQILNKVYKEYNLYLGSLNPFFTKRTLYEDKEVFDNINVEIFDLKDKHSITEYVKKSDIVAMGGGPLMDIYEMYIIKYSFKVAKRYNIKTALVGCGIGPLNNPMFKKITKDIIKLTDLPIFRDEKSKIYAEELVKNKKCYHFVDPAIISIYNYKINHSISDNKRNYAILNVREWPIEYGENSNLTDDNLCNLICKLSKNYEKVYLVPNHTFFIGGDDRVYMNKLNLKNKNHNVEVINLPLSLYELYNLISDSKACIGMRYHAIVMHTILSGNNYIIDYTNPKNGKIVGFLDEMDKPDFYKNRYYSCTLNAKFDCEKCLDILRKDERFEYKPIDNYMSSYEKIFKEC